MDKSRTLKDIEKEHNEYLKELCSKLEKEYGIVLKAETLNDIIEFLQKEHYF